MRIACWQTSLMIYRTVFFGRLEKMLQNLSSAAVVIGALRVNKYTYRRFIFFVYFYCLVSLRCDQTCITVIKRHSKYSRFRVYWSWLGRSLHTLKVVTSLPIPQIHGTVISWKTKKLDTNTCTRKNKLWQEKFLLHFIFTNANVFTKMF